MSLAPSTTLSTTKPRKLTTPGKRPNPADRQYLVIRETSLGPSSGYFNGEAGRNLRSVEIHGATVRLSAVRGEPLAVYYGAKDIKKFTIWADTVEIKGQYALFGCNIEINARVLDGSAGTLVTNGLPIDAPLLGNAATPTNKGADGQAGGSIKLNIYGQGTAPEVKTLGAPGQSISRFRTHADRMNPLPIALNDPGKRDQAFFASPFRDEAMAKALRDPTITPGMEAWRRADIVEEWQYFTWPEFYKLSNEKSALGNITYVEVTLPPHPPGVLWNTGPYLLGRPEGPWTDDSSKYPAPGSGGPGGSVESTIDIPKQLRMQPSGPSSQGVEGQQQPAQAVHLKITLGNPRTNHAATAIFEKKQKKPPAPPAAVRGKEGQFTIIAKTANPSEPQFCSMCQYAKDLFREGYVDDAKAVLDRLPAPAQVQSEQLREFLAEAALLKSRIAHGLDYYGNPPNWVPLLSVETNVSLFHGEIDRAINLFYLSHLISSRWQHQNDRIQVISEALEQTRKAIAAHQQTVLEAVSGCGLLEGQINLVKQQSEAFKKQLDALREELRIEAKNRVNEQVAWEGFKSVLDFLAAMASVVPVGQPFLGIGATAVDEILGVSFDPNKSPDQKVVALFERASTGIKKAAADKDVVASVDTLTKDYAVMDPLLSAGKDLAKEKKTLELKAADNQNKRLLQECVQKIADNDKEIAAATKKKAAEMAALTRSANGVADMATAAAAFAKSCQVSKDEMEDRYQKALTKLQQDSERFQGIKAAFDLLGLRKEELMGKTLALQRIAVQAAGDRAAAVTRLETLLLEREKDVSVLNPVVKAFAERLEKDSVDTLRKYFYFLLRSWEYYFLEPAVEVFDPSDLTKKIREFLQGNDASVTLTQEQFNLLKGVYMQILSALGARLVDKLQTAQPRSQAIQNISLGAEQLSVLNKPIVVPLAANGTATTKLRKTVVNIETLGRLPGQSDDLRIANIELEPEVAAVGAKPLPENITFRIWHSGTSVIVRDGVRYEFVSSGPNARMMWGVTYHSRDKVRTPISVADETSTAILSDLFGGKISQIRRYSPSFLGDLQLSVFSDPADAEFRLDQLRLKVTYEHHALLQ